MGSISTNVLDHARRGVPEYANSVNAFFDVDVQQRYRNDRSRRRTLCHSGVVSDDQARGRATPCGPTDTIALIDAYQVQHQIPSFSAAAEALVRLGLQQSPTEIITPIVTSCRAPGGASRARPPDPGADLHRHRGGHDLSLRRRHGPRCRSSQRRPARALPAAQSVRPIRHATPHRAGPDRRAAG